MTNDIAIWLTTFFEEKNLDDRLYEIEHDGNTHLMPSSRVISIIRDEASPREQRMIMDTLVKIDFHNGDVHDYLKHLATGYIKTQRCPLS